MRKAPFHDIGMITSSVGEYTICFVAWIDCDGDCNGLTKVGAGANEPGSRRQMIGKHVSAIDR